MSTETEIRDAIINELQVGSTIEGLKIEKGIKEPVKNYSMNNEPGVVLVRFIGGPSEEVKPIEFDNGVYQNLGQNEIQQFEIYIGYQIFDKKEEEDIYLITRMVKTLLTNAKVGLSIKPLVCRMQYDIEQNDNQRWVRMIFDTKQKIAQRTL